MPEQVTREATQAAVNDATAVAVGDRHVCVARRSGSVSCWGANDAGQLGQGDQLERLGAVEVPALSDVVKLSAARDVTCALQRSGGVSCWGRSTEDGALGVDPTERGPGIVSRSLHEGTPDVSVMSVTLHHRLTPTSLPCVSEAIDLALGQDVGCVVRADETVACWGSRITGPAFVQPAKFGSATTAHMAGRRYVLAGTHALAVGLSNTQTCVASSDGHLLCFEYNVPRAQDDPVRKLQAIAAMDDVVEVSPPCTRRAGGQVECWGRNDRGELGDGTTDPTGQAHPPTKVALPP